MIQSVNNEYIKSLTKLKQKKYREEVKQFLAEGEHLVQEAINNGLAVEIFCLDETKVPKNNCKVTLVSKAVLEKITFSKTPQSMVALCNYKNDCLDFTKVKRLFILDGLQDPGNIGTIIRTSLAFGFDGIILSEDSVDLYNDKLLRSCQGANFYLPIIQTNILQCITDLRKNNVSVYATSLRNAKNIEEIEAQEKMAFVLGNEGNGVKDSTIDCCDGSIYIPISKAESLNVAIAGGIVAFNFKS